MPFLHHNHCRLSCSSNSLSLIYCFRARNFSSCLLTTFFYNCTHSVHCYHHRYKYSASSPYLLSSQLLYLLHSPSHSDITFALLCLLVLSLFLLVRSSMQQQQLTSSPQMILQSLFTISLLLCTSWTPLRTAAATATRRSSSSSPPLFWPRNDTESEPVMNAIRAGEERLLEEVHEESAAVLKKLKNVTLLTMPDPWDIETIKPKLVFYHKDRPDIQATFDSNPREVALALLNNGFLDSYRLVMITHGFHNNFDTDWLHSYKDAILNRTAANKGQEHTVAILGWGGGADLLVFRYRQAASNVMTVGHWLANYTRAISEVKRGLLIYGIGHSLGAHVMGVAGRESKALSRITGLDPAGPCFEKVANSPTLNQTDAPFVDVIHTDGYDSKLDPSEWFFPVNHYGSLIPIGHLDFYPNYGYHQPGAGTFTVAGSHLRALELFGWSITNPGRFLTADVLADKPDFDEPVDKFIVGKYQVEMGFYADRSHLPPANASTLFYIKTNSQTPWV